MDQFSDVREYIDSRFDKSSHHRKVTIVMSPSTDQSLVGELMDEMPTVSRTRADMVRLERAQAVLNEEDHHAPKQLGWQISTQSNRTVAIQPWEESGTDIIEMDNWAVQPADQSLAEEDWPWDRWILTFLLTMAGGFLILLLALYFLFFGSHY